jgi:hypothetical protein
MPDNANCIAPLSEDDRYWLEKLIADVEAPEQRNYIQGFSPMRLDFMAKMLRRALAASDVGSESVHNDLAVQQLRSIADADRFNREVFEDDTAFADWARSRCRFVLEKINGK